MKYKFEQLSADVPAHCEAASQVAVWSIERPTMKIYTADEIRNHPLGVVAFDGTGDLAGHVAVTRVDEINGGQFGRIGALAVSEKDQGNGVSKDLIKHLLNLTLEELPEVGGLYAFANQKSLSPFLSNGAQIVGVRSPLIPTGCNTIVSIGLPVGAGNG